MFITLLDWIKLFGYATEGGDYNLQFQGMDIAFLMFWNEKHYEDEEVSTVIYVKETLEPIKIMYEGPYTNKIYFWFANKLCREFYNFEELDNEKIFYDFNEFLIAIGKGSK
jgi:hypothetical protein